MCCNSSTPGLQNNTTRLVRRGSASHLFGIHDEFFRRVSLFIVSANTDETHAVCGTGIEWRCHGLLLGSTVTDSDGGGLDVGNPILLYFLPLEFVRQGGVCVCEGFELDGNVDLKVGGGSVS